MAKDNVIRPMFGNKKPRLQLVPTETQTAPSEKASAEGEDLDISGFATVIGAIRIQGLLNKLVRRHEIKINGYKSLVQGYSDAELCKWLENPSDQELGLKPYFFHALIDEANRRFFESQRRPHKETSTETLKRIVPMGEVSDDYKHIGPLEGEAKERAEVDLVFMLANQEYVTEMRDKLALAGEDIFTSGGLAPDLDGIRVRRNELGDHTLEEICNETEKSNALEWHKHPSLLGALALEHHSRVQVAISLLPKDE